MVLEIEQKFVVNGSGWRNLILSSLNITQGYLFIGDDFEIRIRLVDGERAYLTVKSLETGVARDEYEIEIDRHVANELFERFCKNTIIEKVRHNIAALTESTHCIVDEFSGRHSGITVLEVEMSDLQQSVNPPEWALNEVSCDRRYRNHWLSKASQMQIEELKNISIQNSQNGKFEILWSGFLKESDVQIELVEVDLYSPSEQATLDEVWKGRMKSAEISGQKLYNSSLFGLNSIAENVDGRLQIIVHRTDYAGYVASRSPTSALPRANPIGTSIVPITTDGFIPIGKRSSDAEVNPGKLFTFGGFFDADKDIRNGNPNVFQCIIREIKEELGIKLKLESIQLIAIVNDSIFIHPEFCFLTQIGETKDEIKNADWMAELSSIEFVKIENLKKFLKYNEMEFTPTLFGGLHSLALYMDGGSY